MKKHINGQTRGGETGFWPEVGVGGSLLRDAQTPGTYYWRWPNAVISALASINEVNQRRARLVMRWVTVSGFNSRCRKYLSICNQLPRSTQPGHLFVGRRNE